MLLFSVLSYFMFIISTLIIQPVSRRACNLSYVLWVTSSSSVALLVSILSHGYVISFKMKVNNNAFEYFSDQMLFVFLMANLLTGLTNVMINTLKISNYIAILYLSKLNCFLLLK